MFLVCGVVGDQISRLLIYGSFEVERLRGVKSVISRWWRREE